MLCSQDRNASIFGHRDRDGTIGTTGVVGQPNAVTTRCASLPHVVNNTMSAGNARIVSPIRRDTIIDMTIPSACRQSSHPVNVSGGTGDSTPSTSKTITASFTDRLSAGAATIHLKAISGQRFGFVDITEPGGT